MAENGHETSDGLCRDCAARVPAGRDRCPACGSPRVLFHPALFALSTAHVDCDAFYAAIEKRDDPALVDRPVIIGGGRRGVVSTACYIARISGVRSAMPMFKALELCPDAVVIRPNMAKYAAVGREVRAQMLALTPLVEPLSIDEAFLDLAGTEKVHRMAPAATLVRFAQRVEREIGITVSVGLAANKFLAKIASDLEKPRGFSVIGQSEAAAFLAPRPVGFIWGVGKAMEARLARDGIRRIADLQGFDEKTLAKRYGSMGSRLFNLARGIDHRRVEPDQPARSISAETTFETDIADLAELRRMLRRLSEKVSARLKAAGIAGHTVVLKLKTTDFKQRTRNRRLADPTLLADRIFRTGDDLLAREADGTAFRLIGIGVTDLVDPRDADPVDLVDDGLGRRAAAERAMDKVRAKFGDKTVALGLTAEFTAPAGRRVKPAQMPPDED